MPTTAARTSELGQTEKDRPRPSTAGLPPTTDVFTDRPAQPECASKRHPPNLLLTSAVGPPRWLLGSSPDAAHAPKLTFVLTQGSIGGGG